MVVICLIQVGFKMTSNDLIGRLISSISTNSKLAFQLFIAMPLVVSMSARGDRLAYTSFDILDVYEAMLNKV